MAQDVDTFRTIWSGDTVTLAALADAGDEKGNMGRFLINIGIVGATDIGTKSPAGFRVIGL